MAWDDLEKKFIENLLNKRIIYLEGDVNAAMAVNIGKAIIWLNSISNDEITLYIDSPGGDGASGLDIYDAIKHSKAPVTGIVYRRANSMAAVILQACTTRKTMRHSEILFHIVRVHDIKLDKLEENINEALKISKARQESIYKIVSQRSGMPLEKVKKLFKKDDSLWPEEAKKLGFIDEII